MDENDWGVRLADIRVPRLWPIAVLLALVLARVHDRREHRELKRIGTELGTYVGERDQATSEREARLLKLTAVLAWLTGAVLVAAVASIVVTLAH